MRFFRFGNPQSSRGKDGILQVERSRKVRPLQENGFVEHRHHPRELFAPAQRQFEGKGLDAAVGDRGQPVVDAADRGLVGVDVETPDPAGEAQKDAIDGARRSMEGTSSHRRVQAWESADVRMASRRPTRARMSSRTSVGRESRRSVAVAAAAKVFRRRGGGIPLFGGRWRGF
jgi:hypothetical protein